MERVQGPAADGRPEGGGKKREGHGFRLEKPDPPVGHSKYALRIAAFREAVADVPEGDVLYSGEPGSGKDNESQQLHWTSEAREEPFVSVNFAAVVETLAESELFGHEEGAFNGARQRRGRFELAGRGRIFLNQLDCAPPSVQAKILDVISDRVFTPVGGERRIPFQGRIIAALNVDLATSIESGRLRADLIDRFGAFHLHLPPLRERAEDILPLARAFIERTAAKHRKPVRPLSREAEDWLLQYRWPGNIRELRNVIRRATVFGAGKVITVEDLKPESLGQPISTLAVVLSEAERIVAALNRSGGRIEVAAETLGMSRNTLWKKMKDYGIERRYMINSAAPTRRVGP